MADKDEVKVDATELYEEYTAPPRLDEQGRPVTKSRGLKAAGYSFPPAGGPAPPLTKANLAKGIGLPEPVRAPSPSAHSPSAQSPATPNTAGRNASNTTQAYPVPDSLVRQLEPAPIARPVAPAVLKVDEGAQFEEYRRADLDAHPKTGKGIRTEPPPPPSAKELLQAYEPPVPEVVTPKRFSIMPGARKADSPRPDEEAAHIDAVADLAATAAAGLVMSHSVANGPIKMVIHDEDGREEAHGQVESKPGDALGPSVPVFASMQGTTPYVHPFKAVSIPEAATSMGSTLPAGATAPLVTSPAAAPSPVAPARRASATTNAGSPHRDELRVEPGPDAPRIGIVRCLYNNAITAAMLAHARDEAERLGSRIIATVEVPGVYDAPLASKRLLARDDVDAIVVLGVVIQGETGHDLLITQATAQTLQALAVNADKPVGLGITGPRMTEAQAWQRIENGAFAVASVVAQCRALKTA